MFFANYSRLQSSERRTALLSYDNDTDNAAVTHTNVRITALCGWPAARFLVLATSHFVRGRISRFAAERLALVVCVNKWPPHQRHVFAAHRIARTARKVFDVRAQNLHRFAYVCACERNV